MSKSRIKRLAAAVLSMTLAISAIPFGVYAAEEQKHITVDGSIEGDYRILERGDELLFSAKDLAEISGFSYLEEDGQIILSRGAKDVRIDPKKSQMYLLEGTGADTDRKLKTKPVEENGDWFLPGSEVLPQLNVSILGTEDGYLYIHRDDISIWDIYEDFDAKDYKFDFARACTNMGIETNETKVLAALNNKGLSEMTKVGKLTGHRYQSGVVTYTDLFEDMVLEKESSEEAWNIIWKDADIIVDLLDLAGALTGGSGSEIDLGSIFTFADEMGEYALLAKHAETIESDKLELIKAVQDNYNGNYHYAEEIREAASSISNTYTEIDKNGALAKLNETFRKIWVESEMSLDLSSFSTAMDPYFKEFGVSNFAEELKDVDNAVYYEVLSNCARAAFEDYGMEHGTDCFRHHAMIYMYACEYSWRAMAEYAKRLKSSYADDFEFIADICLERKGELYACAASSANDNRGFDEKSDKEETKRLKGVFEVLIRKSTYVAPVINSGKSEGNHKINSKGEANKEQTQEPKVLWVNTKITVYNSEDTSLSPKTMAEMTYDEEGRLLTKYVTDYELAQYPFVNETEEYKYDQNGNILFHLSLNEYRGYKMHETYLYDEHGNKTAYMIEDSLVTIYEYDENNRLIRESVHEVNPALAGNREWAMAEPGEIRSEYFYEYDNNGRLSIKLDPGLSRDSEFAKYTSEDNVLFNDSWHEYTYGEDGKLLKEAYFAFGTKGYEDVYTYDERGNLLSKVTLDDDYPRSEEYEYNENNVCVSRKTYSRENLTTEVTYNDQGKTLTLITYDFYDNIGEKTNELRYEYDEEGRKIRCWYNNSLESGISEYTYDENGNLKFEHVYDFDGNLKSYAVFEYQKLK